MAGALAMTAVDLAVVGLAGTALYSLLRRTLAQGQRPGWRDVLATAATAWLVLYHVADLVARWGLGEAGAQVVGALGFQATWTVAAAAALALFLVTRMDQEARRRRLEAVSWSLMEGSEVQGGRVAQALHDGASQEMTVVKLALEGLRREASDDETSARVAEAVSLVDRSIDSLRGLALELRPPMLDDLGLAAALRSEATRQVEGSGLETSLSGFNDLPRASSVVETACFRIAQEAVANVVQHSGARRLSIELRGDGERIGLVVDDDGAGFDLEKTLNGREAEPPFGLWVMQERASLALGELAIESRPGEGTRVSASFPRALNGNTPSELLV